MLKRGRKTKEPSYDMAAQEGEKAKNVTRKRSGQKAEKDKKRTEDVTSDLVSETSESSRSPDVETRLASSMLLRRLIAVEAKEKAYRQRYLDDSWSYCFAIFQGFVALLEFIAPLPEGWKTSGYVVIWANPSGPLWALTMGAIVLSTGIAGAVLVNDMRFNFAGAASVMIPILLPVMLVFYHSSWSPLLQKYDWMDDTHPLLLALIIAIGVAVGGKVLLFKILRRNTTRDISLRHWIGLLLLLICAAAEWHFIWGTLTCMGAEDTLRSMVVTISDETSGLLENLEVLLTEYQNKLATHPVSTMLELILLIPLWALALILLLFLFLASLIPASGLTLLLVYLVLPTLGLLVDWGFLVRGGEKKSMVKLLFELTQLGLIPLVVTLVKIWAELTHQGVFSELVVTVASLLLLDFAVLWPIRKFMEALVGEGQR
jgi:hypothetical protein